jgi:YidC/Oxa1 family membrane protein insertase
VLPGVFGVMMLFLPAALGVYMMTNSLLGIAQQVVTNRITPPPASTTKGEIVVKPSRKRTKKVLFGLARLM